MNNTKNINLRYYSFSAKPYIYKNAQPLILSCSISLVFVHNSRCLASMLLADIIVEGLMETFNGFFYLFWYRIMKGQSYNGTVLKGYHKLDEMTFYWIPILLTKLWTSQLLLCQTQCLPSDLKICGREMAYHCQPYHKYRYVSF
jgi:hypothetical protein